MLLLMLLGVAGLVFHASFSSAVSVEAPLGPGSGGLPIKINLSEVGSWPPVQLTNATPAAPEAAKGPEWLFLSLGSSGRLGNSLERLLQGLLFASRSHVRRVLVSVTDEWQQLAGIFQPGPLYFFMLEPVPGPPSCLEMAQRYPVDVEQLGMYSLPPDIEEVYVLNGTSGCPGATLSELHELALQHLVHLFRPELKDCLAAGDSGPEDEVLTISLRSGDLWGVAEEDEDRQTALNLSAPAHHWLWQHLPCRTFEQILRDEGLSQIVVVTSDDQRHPCVQWLLDWGQEAEVPVAVQSGSLWQDACVLLRARNLVLAYSTFSEHLAILSQRAKRIFSRSRYLGKLFSCKAWPGVMVQQYIMPITEDNHPGFKGTYGGLLEWLFTYQNSSRRSSCKVPLKPDWF